MSDNMFLMAEMLSTRMCHDITGPVGAINNGAELLEEDPSMLDLAMDLISSSAKEAVARLQFYRHAYGRINALGEANLDDKKVAAETFLQGAKIALTWDATAIDFVAPSLNQQAAKLLINMIVIAQSSLMKGGEISVEIVHDERESRIAMVAKGDMIKFADDFTKILQGDTSVKVDPKTVQVYLTYYLAEAEGFGLEVHYNDEEMTITAHRQNNII